MNRITVCLLCLIVSFTYTASLHAQDVGAIASGNWANPAIWTSGTVPSAGNNVYIGSNDYPIGAAFNVTVALTQDQSANEVWLGFLGGNGTINLANSVLTTNSLYVGQSGTGTITRGTGSFQTANLNVSGTTVALSASDVITTLINLFGNGSITNDGALNIQSWQAFLSNASLHDGNDSISFITLQGSQLRITDSIGQLTGLTLGDYRTLALNISSDSKLILDIDGQGADWIFRWANPTVGNHISDLTNLIISNRIQLNNPDNFPYQIYSSSDGYTYIANAVPEPGSILLAGSVGLAAFGYYRFKRTASRRDALLH